jgi:hypothetical protein
VIIKLFIRVQFWQKLSTIKAMLFGLVGWGLVNTWWRALRYIGRVRDLYREGSVTEVEQGSPLDIAVGVAAGAISDILFFGSGATVLSMGFVVKLLNRVPMK